jgi:hypothetical protein
MADNPKWKIAITDSETGHDGFLLVSWDQQADGNFKVAVNQSDPGNLVEVERAVRVLSRLLSQSKSPLYEIIGESCLSTMDFAIEKYAEIASPISEA